MSEETIIKEHKEQHHTYTDACPECFKENKVIKSQASANHISEEIMSFHRNMMNNKIYGGQS